MMDLQPDKLFREKLESYHATIPGGAWNKLENKLDKKNYTGFWLKVAASLLLLSVSIYLLDRINSDTTKTTNRSADLIKPKVQTPKINPVIVSPQNKKEEKRANPLQRKRIKENLSVPENMTITSNEESIDRRETVIQPIQSSDSVNVLNDTRATDVATTSTKEWASEKHSSATIIFTAEEVNKKYLTTSISSEATDQEKKPSGFKKLLNKAYGLKKNQNPFGELRQKKNEILALNFKSDKEGQKK